MKLREYETKAVRALPGLLTVHRRVVCVAPTGSGKTVIAAHVIREMLGKRVLWLAHRVELIEQAYEEIAAAGIQRDWLRMLTGPRKVGPEDALITVASIDMFHRRDLPPFDLAVVDEAHRVMAKSYRRAIGESPTLGLTATPWRLDGKGLGDVFAHMYVAAGPSELIADGFLAAPVAYGVPRDKARALVRGVQTRGGDFAPQQLAEVMMRNPLMGDIVKEWERLARGRATLVFAVNREHGRALRARFASAGHSVGYLDGETPAGRRRALLARLRSGDVRVVVNVDVLTDGFDCPPVKCISLARPTKSLTRFLQYVGRASRPHGRQRPIILDHAGNCWRFGLPHAEREWSLEDRPKGGSGEAPVKLCPGCAAMIPIMARECPECGAEQEIAEPGHDERNAKLERVRALEREKAAARKRVEKIAKEKGAPSGWAEKVLNAMFEVA